MRVASGKRMQLHEREVMAALLARVRGKANDAGT